VENEAAEIAALYEKEKAERERLAAESLANATVPFEREPKRGALIMGKQKKALETSLDYGERLRLKDAIAN